MLEHRQLIGVRARGVDQLGHERHIHRSAEHLRRPFDGQLHLGARQPRREVLGAVDGVWQQGEAHAVAEEVRAHRQHDVNACVADRARLEQQVHEQVGVVGVFLVSLGVREDFLELIDDDQQVRARAVRTRRRKGLGACMQQAERTAPQLRFDHRREVRRPARRGRRRRSE